MCGTTFTFPVDPDVANTSTIDGPPRAADATTLRDAAALGAAMDSRYPGISERLVDEQGLRRFVNVYLNDEDVRFLGGLDTVVADGDSVTILPAVAGG